MSKKNGTTLKSSTASNTHADGIARKPGGATPIQLVHYSDIPGLYQAGLVGDDVDSLLNVMFQKLTTNRRALKRLAKAAKRGLTELKSGKRLEMQLASSYGCTCTGFFRRPVDGEKRQDGILILHVDSSDRVTVGCATPDNDDVSRYSYTFNEVRGRLSITPLVHSSPDHIDSLQASWTPPRGQYGYH